MIKNNFNEKPLEGIRILDLGVVGAGPIGPTLLGEFGAEVIKVEEPGMGNLLRMLPRKPQSPSFWWAVEGRNKRSITVNMRTAKGQEIIKKLVKISDVVLENYRPGTLEKWNLGYEELKKIKEDIILIRASGFGQTGPYIHRTSYDTIGAAMGGVIYVTGYPDMPPLRLGLNLCDYFTAAFNALATLLALYYRGKTGMGQWAEIAQYEAVFRLSESTVAAYDKIGQARERTGNRHPSIAPGDLFSTKDKKWVAIATTNDRQFRRLVKAMGQEGLAQDPRFITMAKRVENADVINDILATWIKERGLEEVMGIMVRAKIPVSPVYSAKEICHDPHIKERDNLVEVEIPPLGKVKVQDVVPKLSLTPGGIQWPGLPLGHHTAEILSQYLGLREDEIIILEEEGITEPAPSAVASLANPGTMQNTGKVRIPDSMKPDNNPMVLEGIRVLELGSALAGSFGATLLGDFGAEVIKVEEPEIGDDLRHLPPFHNGYSLWWSVEGRNKKSITIDLRTGEGQRIFKELVKVTDIIIESFSPGTLEEWHLGYEDLRRLNDKIILVRVSGFGQSGPYRDRASCDAVAAAMGGFTSLTGFPEKPPVNAGFMFSEYLAGVFNALGVMMALFYRDIRNTGKGQWIDLATYEPLLRFSHDNIPAYHKFGIVDGLTGNALGLAGPASIFKTRDAKWLVILAASDKDFSRINKAMEREDLTKDPRFQTISGRGEHYQELNHILGEWVSKFNLEEITKILEENSIPFSPVYNIKDIFSDPHYLFRRNILEIDDPYLGKIKMQDVVPKLSLTPGSVKTTGPILGQHNEDIFTGVLGLSREEIEHLKKGEII